MNDNVVTVGKSNQDLIMGTAVGWVYHSSRDSQWAVAPTVVYKNTANTSAYFGR